MDLISSLSLKSYKPDDLPYARVRPDEQNIPAHVTGVMDVDLGAIQHNYTVLRGIAGLRTKVIPVIKANAYGMGMVPVAQALWTSGAHAFFVADLNEGIALRRHIPQAMIFILAGVWEGTEGILEEHDLTPVLIDPYQVTLWQRWALKRERRMPACLHVDTGMRRTGIPLSDLKTLLLGSNPWEGLDLKMLMSHLACSSEPDHLMNMKQLRLFKDVASYFPHLPASLAASGGLFMGPAYHFDIIRPGMLLYGLRPNSMCIHEALDMRPCLRVAVRVLQVQQAEAGETVGYGASYRFGQRTRIATLALGHADGYLRPLSHQGVVMISGHKAPVVGRISMDLVTVDVTQVPESCVYPGQWADVINDQITVDDMARQAHTVTHEVLVRLGPRYHRRYFL